MQPATQSGALAQLAGLLADDTRAAFCLALFDGRAWTAGELARHAGVAPSTASEHLSRLVAGGLLVERRQGRHRYVELAGAHVAELIEDFMSHLEPPEERPRSLRSRPGRRLRVHGRATTTWPGGWAWRSPTP